MNTKRREVIWSGRIMGAKMRAKTARQEARKAVRAADGAEAEGMVGPQIDRIIAPRPEPAASARPAQSGSAMPGRFAARWRRVRSP